MRFFLSSQKLLSKDGAAVAVTLAVTGALLLLCRYFPEFEVPALRPLMFLVLAAGTYFGGARAGVISLAAVIGYFLFHFVGPEVPGPTRFSDHNLTHLLLVSLSAAVIVTTIGVLRARLRESEIREAALHTAEQARKALTALIEGSRDAIIGATCHGIITSWNGAAERMSGFAADEMIGRHIAVLAPPEYQAQQAEQFAGACRGERDRTYEGPCVGKNGRSLEWIVYFLPSLADDGTVQSVMCIAEDRSEQKRSQSALRDSEERFRQVAENLPGALWVRDLNGKYLYVSPGFEAIHGYPLKSFLEDQHAFVEAIYPDDRQKLFDAHRTRKPGEAFDEEFRVLHTDGSLVWVSNRGFPVHRADGGLECMVGIATNITGSKRAEEALRESEARFRLLVENASDAFYVHDTRGRFVNVNSVACQALGYEREELLKMTVADVDVDLDWKEHPPFWNDIRSGEVRVVSGIHRRKDGTTFPIQAHVSVVSTEGGPKLLMASVRDISEQERTRKLLEVKARQQQAVSSLGLRALRAEASNGGGLDALFDEALLRLVQTLEVDFGSILEFVAAEGMYVFRADYGWLGDRRGRMGVELNDGNGTLIRYTLENRKPVVITDYRTETRFSFPKGLAAQGAVSGMSVVIYLEDESVYGTLSVHCRKPRYFTDDDVAFVQATANILSASISRFHARESLHQALDAAAVARLEAEQANHAKSEFLSRMSHELRTPLNAILGFGQLLQMGEGSSAMNKDCANHIVSAGRHLLSLVDDILDISRIEAGNDAFYFTSVSVPEMCENAVQLVRPAAEERQVRLQIKGGRLAHCAVTADERRLKQVLLNLLSNAIKFNTKEGEVTVDWVQGDAGTIRLRVHDTGPGLSPAQIERLYTPFERLDAEQRGIDGTGLGLALARRFVESMGGTLGVDSTPGEGSVFWVELPAAELAAPAGGGGSPDGGASGALGHHEPLDDEKVAILQIEDNPSNQRVVQMLVDTHRPRWRLLSAYNARAGLDIARRQQPALILLDLQLPDLAGDEVLGMLREDRDTSHIPVVMLSADATSRSRERLLAAGAAAYVNKPFEVSELLKLLDEMLEAASAVANGDPGEGKGPL